MSRYDYRYTTQELEDWADRIKKSLDTLSLMVIAFNNHYRGQAVDNALEMKELLKGGAA